MSNRPPLTSPLCTGCEYTLVEPNPAKKERYATWRITHVDPDCVAHGYMTRINLAADLRYGD